MNTACKYCVFGVNMYCEYSPSEQKLCEEDWHTEVLRCDDFVQRKPVTKVKYSSPSTYFFHFYLQGVRFDCTNQNQHKIPFKDLESALRYCKLMKLDYAYVCDTSSPGQPYWEYTVEKGVWE